MQNQDDENDDVSLTSNHSIDLDTKSRLMWIVIEISGINSDELIRSQSMFIKLNRFDLEFNVNRN